MKWEKKYWLLPLLLLLLSSPISWAEVCLSDEDHQELVTILDNLENTLIEQETLLQQQETQLATSQSEIETLKQMSEELKKSYAEQKLKTIIQAGSVGFIIGTAFWLVLDLLFTNIRNNLTRQLDKLATLQ